ncbi:MAG TPA: hypothetical protein VE964_16970 [Myxococcales bacterium]|nr:hypothetical protein [Myxococcales bacterium]
MSARKALILALLASAAARADGSATTLFDSKPYFRDGGQQDNSFYEAFALNARAEGTNWLQDVRVVARGWGRVTAGPPFDEQHTTGDLDSFFVEGRLLQRHLLLRVGRQLTTGGAVRATQVDGLAADALVAYGLGVQTWVGVPVQPRFNTSSGDFITGGRAYWRQAFDSELGASYVYTLRKGYVAQSDVALDGSWTPIRPVTVNALAQWNLDQSRFAEGRLQGLWQVNRKLQLVADVQRTAPDLFVDHSSFFWTFSEETRDEAGGEIVYRLLQEISLEGDWHWLRVQGGHGHRAGARATYRTPYSGSSYGAEFRFLTEPDNGYKLARVFGIRKLPRNINITLDLDAYWLEQQVNAQQHAFVGTLTGGWAFLPNWEAMLAGSLGTTPYFERRTEIIARLVYRFGIPASLPGGFR